jgi:hypothetical protein
MSMLWEWYKNLLSKSTSLKLLGPLHKERNGRLSGICGPEGTAANLVFYLLYNETWVSSVFNVIIYPKNSKYGLSYAQLWYDISRLSSPSLYVRATLLLLFFFSLSFCLFVLLLFACHYQVLLLIVETGYESRDGGLIPAHAQWLTSDQAEHQFLSLIWSLVYAGQAQP